MASTSRALSATPRTSALGFYFGAVDDSHDGSIDIDAFYDGFRDGDIHYNGDHYSGDHHDDTPQGFRVPSQ